MLSVVERLFCPKVTNEVGIEANAIWRKCMESTFETKQERAVLVGLNADCFTKAQTATDETLEELEALLETAGGFCTGKVLQNRHTPDSHCFIGEGKAQEGIGG